MRRSFRTLRRRFCHPRGSTPGWYAVPRWGTPKAVLPTSFPHTARADASTVGFLSQVSRITKTRSREARPNHPPPTSASPTPHNTQGSSGIGPERALESITQHPRAQRESSSFPEPPQRPEVRSRGAHPKPGQQRDEAGASIGGDLPTPSRTARNLILPRASLRAQDSSRGPPPTTPPSWSFILSPHPKPPTAHRAL